MSDLWFEATANIEQENTDRLLIAARQEVAPLIGFLTAAYSQQDYENRKALVRDKMFSAVASVTVEGSKEFTEVASLLEQSFDEDYATVAKTRKRAYSPDEQEAITGGGTIIDEAEARNLLATYGGYGEVRVYGLYGQNSVYASQIAAIKSDIMLDEKIGELDFLWAKSTSDTLKQMIRPAHRRALRIRTNGDMRDASYLWNLPQGEYEAVEATNIPGGGWFTEDPQGREVYVRPDDAVVVEGRRRTASGMFSIDGHEFGTGIAQADGFCLSCGQTVAAGWECYAAVGEGGEQYLVDRWCGLDLLRRTEGRRKQADEGATSERIKKSIHTMIMEARPDAEFVSGGDRNLYRIEGKEYTPGEADEKFLGGEWSRTRGWMASRRKQGWTEDFSDVSYMADKLMDLSLDAEMDFLLDDADAQREATIQRLMEAFKPLLNDITDDDQRILEDYNFHITNEAIDRLKGNKKFSRKTAGKYDDAEKSFCDNCGQEILRYSNYWFDTGQTGYACPGNGGGLHEPGLITSPTASLRKRAESFGLVNGAGEFLVDTEAGGIRVTKSEVNAGRFNRPTADSLLSSVQSQMGGQWEVISLSGSRRTAGVYCKTHDVWVGDGNAANHDEGCEKEQRATDKTKESGIDTDCAECGHEFWDHRVTGSTGSVDKCRFGDCPGYLSPSPFPRVLVDARKTAEVNEQIRRELVYIPPDHVLGDGTKVWDGAFGGVQMTPDGEIWPIDSGVEVWAPGLVDEILRSDTAGRRRATSRHPFGRSAKTAAGQPNPGDQYQVTAPGTYLVNDPTELSGGQLVHRGLVRTPLDVGQIITFSGYRPTPDWIDREIWTTADGAMGWFITGSSLAPQSDYLAPVEGRKKTAAAKTPTQIAADLQGRFPHLNIHFGNTGGGVMCIVAWRDLGPEQGFYIGTASGNLGYSDEFGEVNGEWEDLVNTDEDDRAWTFDQPLAQGDEITERIAGLFEEWLPHVASKTASEYRYKVTQVIEDRNAFGPLPPDRSSKFYESKDEAQQAFDIVSNRGRGVIYAEFKDMDTGEMLGEFSASRKTAQWIDDGDASEYESEGIGEAYVRPHYEIAFTGEGDREEEQDGWDWDAFTYDSLPTRGTGHSPDRNKAKELAAKWVQDNAGGVGVGQLFGHKTAGWAGYTLVDESKLSDQYHKRFIGYFESEAEAKAFAESEYGVAPDVWSGRVYLTSVPGNPEVSVVNGQEVPFTGSKTAAVPKGYDTLTSEQIALYDLIMEIVDWPWFGTVTPSNLLDVAQITRRQLAQRALQSVLSRNDAERRGDTGYVKVLNEGIARDDAWGKTLDEFIEKGWATASRKKFAFEESAKCPNCGEHGDYADESGQAIVESPGAISPPLSWGGKLVCPNDGTVWQYVSLEEMDRRVREFNDIHYSQKTAAERPEPWPESACGEQDEDTFCVLDVGHGEDHVFRSRQWIENVLPAPGAAPVEEVPEEGEEEVEQPEQAPEEEPAKDSNVPPQFKKK